MSSRTTTSFDSLCSLKHKPRKCRRFTTKSRQREKENPLLRVNDSSIYVKQVQFPVSSCQLRVPLLLRRLLQFLRLFLPFLQFLRPLIFRPFNWFLRRRFHCWIDEVISSCHAQYLSKDNLKISKPDSILSYLLQMNPETMLLEVELTAHKMCRRCATRIIHDERTVLDIDRSEIKTKRDWERD